MSYKKITFILGNKNAALQNMRYIERDLNRSFDTESTETAEHKRAKEIEKILKKKKYRKSIKVEPKNFICKEIKPTIYFSLKIFSLQFTSRSS